MSAFRTERTCPWQRMSTSQILASTILQPTRLRPTQLPTADVCPCSWYALRSLRASACSSSRRYSRIFKLECGCGMIADRSSVLFNAEFIAAMYCSRDTLGASSSITNPTTRSMPFIGVYFELNRINEIPQYSFSAVIDHKSPRDRCSYRKNPAIRHRNDGVVSLPIRGASRDQALRAIQASLPEIGIVLE